MKEVADNRPDGTDDQCLPSTNSFTLSFVLPLELMEAPRNHKAALWKNTFSFCNKWMHESEKHGSQALSDHLPSPRLCTDSVSFL